MRGRGFLVVALGAVALAACGSTQLQTTGAKVPVPSGKAASFDDVEIDQATQTVYVADRTNTAVDVFDVSGPQPSLVSTIKLPAAPNGLAMDGAHGRVFAGTASGAIEVIDAATRSVVAEIKTPAQEIDLLDFAPGPDWLLASTGAGGTLLTIDPESAKVIATATVGKPLEQPRYDSATGDVYVSVPDLGALAQIDPKSGTVKATRKLTACIPVGLAIRSTTGTALVACHKSVVAFDLRSGQTTNLGPRASDGDVVQYFSGSDRFFVAAPHSAVPSVVGMFGGDPVSYLGSATVDGGGNAVVYDGRSDTLYTTDTRSGTAGLMGFHMDGTRPVAIWQSALFVIVPLVILLLIVGPLWIFLGRHGDPIHRKRPATT